MNIPFTIVLIIPVVKHLIKPPVNDALLIRPPTNPQSYWFVELVLINLNKVFLSRPCATAAAVGS